MGFPKQGQSKQVIQERMLSYRTNDLNIRSGRVWAYVYDAGKEAEEMGKWAYMEFLEESGLDPTVFPSLMRFENELVGMCRSHVNGGPDVVGNFTSGGTESIILAVKTARDYFRKTRPEITEPEMILPVTGHAAFHKAALYLGLKVVLTDVDETSFKAKVDPVRQAVTPNTILIVGSAPSYAHGVIDPIREMAAIAMEHDLWFHVDACMGGFLLPYFKRLGEDIPDFGFETPGVWSLSMDLHKYAYCPKNASVILYRNKDLRRHQIYACSNWTGYTVVNNTIQSSKTGGSLAAAYAVVNFLGDEGYLELARKKLDATKRVAAAIDGMDDLYLQGRPQMCLVSFASDTVNVFHVIDEMKLKGWYVQPQLAYGPSKKNIHLSINAGNFAQVDAMIADLKECVNIAKTIPAGDLAQSAKEMFAQLNPDDFTEAVFQNMLGMAGMNSIDLPGRMAEINDVLDSLPFQLREKLLVEFLNQLYTPE